MRITAQLINVSNGYHLWSERFDREMQDVFAVQDEIALAIAAVAQGAPAPGQARRRSSRPERGTSRRTTGT